MKNIYIAILITVSICFAEKSQVLRETIYDTVIFKQTIIDTVSRHVADSVTIEALKNSQEFYSSSFNNILWLVGIIIAIGCTIFGCFGSYNWWKAKRYNEETKKEIEKIKNDFNNKVSYLENSLKEQIKNQNENFKLSKDNTFREIAISYLPNTYKHIKSEIDASEVFSKIGFYYSVLQKNKVELNEDDFKQFRYENEYIRTFIYELPDSFEISTIDFFLYSLNKITEYCVETKKEEHLEKLKETQELLFEKIGREKILDAIQKSIKWRTQVV